MLTKEQKKTALMVVLILTIGLLVSFYKYYKQSRTSHYLSYTPPTKSVPSSNITILTHKKEKIMVHIAGAVRSPGLYNIPKGLRPIEAVKLAGGFLPQANLDKVNLAKTLKDGNRLFIPATKTSQKKSIASPSLININAATITDFETLPGIGKKTAASVIANREKVGAFQSIAELLGIKGIGPKKLKKITPFLTL
jgi:competence protein ComEA